MPIGSEISRPIGLNEGEGAEQVLRRVVDDLDLERRKLGGDFGYRISKVGIIGFKSFSPDQGKYFYLVTKNGMPIEALPGVRCGCSPWEPVCRQAAVLGDGTGYLISGSEHLGQSLDLTTTTRNGEVYPLIAGCEIGEQIELGVKKVINGEVYMISRVDLDRITNPAELIDQLTFATQRFGWQLANMTMVPAWHAPGGKFEEKG